MKMLSDKQALDKFVGYARTYEAVMGVAISNVQSIMNDILELQSIQKCIDLRMDYKNLMADSATSSTAQSMLDEIINVQELQKSRNECMARMVAKGVLAIDCANGVKGGIAKINGTAESIKG